MMTPATGINLGGLSMKRSFKFFAALAVASLVFSCSKEAEVEKTNPSEKHDATESESATGIGESNLDPELYLLGFGASCEKSDESKVSVDLTSGTTAFEAGDEALVCVPDAGAKGIYVYTENAGGEGVDLFVPKDEENAVAVGSNVAYVYYPAGEFAESEGTVTFTMPEAVTAGSADDLGNKVPMSGIIANSGNSTDVPVAQFKNLGSILRVSFNSAAADGETITSVELSVEGANITGSGAVSWDGETPAVAALDGTTAISVETADGHLTNSAYKEFYFFLPAGGELTSMTVKAVYGKTVGTTTYSPYEIISRTSALTPVRNKIYTVTKTLGGFFSGGDGSEAYPYVISSVNEFTSIATLANASAAAEAGKLGNGYNSDAKRTFFGSAGVHYQQSADIDFDSAELSSIGVYDDIPFQGVYDGNNKSLKKFKVTGTQAASTGLFEYVSGATLKNIIISTAVVTGTNVAGILTGRCIGATVIEGCSSTGGQVAGRNSVGFVAHITGTTTVTGCSVSNLTVITADGSNDANNQGGVVGYAGDKSSIESCTTAGDIVFTGMPSGTARGGIVGKFDSSGSVSGCTNAAAISSLMVDCTGGIAGQITEGTITKCVNTGKVDGGEMSCVGGVVGSIGSGSTTRCKLELSRNTGNITAGNTAGGIAGKVIDGSWIQGCYSSSTCSVEAMNYIGGAVGYVTLSKADAGARIIISECLTKSNVTIKTGATGAGRAGGFIGDASFTNNVKSYIFVYQNGVAGGTVTDTDKACTHIGAFSGRSAGYKSGSTCYLRYYDCYSLADLNVGSNASVGGFGSAGSTQFARAYYSADNINQSIASSCSGSPSKIESSAIKSQTLNGGNTPNLGTARTLGTWTIDDSVAYPVPTILFEQGTAYYSE